MKILWCILSAVGLMKSAAKNKISLWGCILAVAWWSVATAEARSMPSLALYGEPKYTADFTNFEYANPKAPKGGRVVMPSYGNFDSLNPFIFKGNAATEAATLTLDTLGIVPVDDYSTVYPLLAKKFELPQDHSFVGFELDERAKFSNGKPVTADDVIFSFKAITEQGAPIYKVYYADVDKVEKVNDRKVRFYFKKNSQNKELPLILARKNLECFVQEHKRREVDFRITVVNKEETIPAIVVPDESGVGMSENGAEGKEASRQEGKNQDDDSNDVHDVHDVCRDGGSDGVVKGEEEKKGEEHPEVVFVQEMVEEESEELRISEMDAISRDVIQSIPEVKEKRRKAKMINLDWAVC